MQEVPLKKHDTQVHVAGTLLVETLPEDVHRLVHGGATTSVRYAFHEDMSMQLKHWNAMDGRGGLSAGAFFPLGPSADKFIQTEVGMAYDANTIDGWALAVRFGRTEAIMQNLFLLAAIGPVVGSHSVSDVSKGEWGAGALLNVGLSYQISAQWFLGLEAASVFQYNNAQKSSSFVVSPSLGCSVVF